MNNLTDAAINGGAHESIRQFRVFQRGGAKFALTTDDIVTIADWRRPTPLPHAPAAVLGVVSIHGRMLTVLDPFFLLRGSHSENGCQCSLIALRGDEQLALVVDNVTENVTAEMSPLDDAANRGVLGAIQHDGDSIEVIDINRLFPLAIRGRERRKRGFQSFQ